MSGYPPPDKGQSYPPPADYPPPSAAAPPGYPTAEGVPVSSSGVDTKHSPYGYPPSSQYGGYGHGAPPPGYPGASGHGGGYGAPPPSYYGPPPGYGHQQQYGHPQQVYVQQGKPGPDACLTACLAALCCCCMADCIF
ncbi:hypothetical protein ACK3TF_001921 [Chlorella vulgaris]